MVAVAKPAQANTKSNEWYTPSRYIEAAREVMGGIDLDPASCSVANETVRASRYYSKEDDGLAQEWYGKVWLNPPFTGTHLRAIWVQRLINEYTEEHISQAILLMPTGVDTQWFQPLWQFPICFPSSRIRFYRDDVQCNSPNFAACFVYLGPHEHKFIEAFSQFGPIAKRVEVPRQATTCSNLWEVR